MIDSERSIRYYVHGQLVKQHNFLQILNNLKALITVANEFATARVCDGLGDIDIHLANFVSIYKDNMKIFWECEGAQNCPKDMSISIIVAKCVFNLQSRYSVILLLIACDSIHHRNMRGSVAAKTVKFCKRINDLFD